MLLKIKDQIEIDRKKAISFLEGYNKKRSEKTVALQYKNRSSTDSFRERLVNALSKSTKYGFINAAGTPDKSIFGDDGYRDFTYYCSDGYALVRASEGDWQEGKFVVIDVNFYIY